MRVVLFSFLFFSIPLLPMSAAFGQKLSKEEKSRLRSEQKRWKKKLKSMSAEKFHEVISKHETLKNTSTTFDNELRALKQDAETKKIDLERLDKSVARLEDRIEALKAECGKEGAEETTGNTSPKFSKGAVIHKVQVGDFNDPTLKAFQEEGEFWEKDKLLEDNAFRKVYTIGYFEDNFQAQAFKKMLRKMGLKDAYVQSYQDGKKSTH